MAWGATRGGGRAGGSRMPPAEPSFSGGAGGPPPSSPVEAGEIGPGGDKGGGISGVWRRMESADGEQGDEGERTSRPTLEMSLAVFDEGGEAGGGAASRRAASRAAAITRVRPDSEAPRPGGGLEGSREGERECSDRPSSSSRSSW